MQIRKGLDLSLGLGLVIGLGGIVVAYLWEGGDLVALWVLPPLLLVVAGTAGSAIISFGWKAVVGIPGAMVRVMSPANGPNAVLAGGIVQLSDKARKEGLLSLDDLVEDLEDPLFRKGIRMVVDGVDPDEIEALLETDIAFFDHERREQAEVFSGIGGYLPTIGIIGTVTSLVIVLANLGGADMTQLGHAIASAFIATLYGISFANIWALPTATNLKGKLKVEKHRMAMIVTGVFAIHKGESPLLVREKMATYLDHAERLLLENSPEEA